MRVSVFWRGDRNGPVEATRVQIAGAHQSSDTLRRVIVTTPADLLGATDQTSLLVFDVAKTLSWVGAEDLARRDHTSMVSRI